MTPELIAPDSRTDGDFNVTQVWLEALARGTCDEDAFLRAIQMLTRRSPEAAWDSLALLDQFYRRGKIKAEVFRRVKSRLGSQLLGPALDVDHSVPLTRSQASPVPAPAAIPMPPGVAPAPGGAAPASKPAPAWSAPPPAPEPPPTPASAPATQASPVHPPVTRAPPMTQAPPPTHVRPPPVTQAPPEPFAAMPAAPAASPSRPRPAARAEISTPLPRISASNARTVPIGIEEASIPVLEEADPSASPTAQVAPVSDREVTVGDLLRGRYEIKNVLGLGGTGTVFEAIDRFRLDLPDSGQRVAIKVLYTDATRRSTVLTDLRREFQLLQSLSHPNIVRAHEYDRDGDTAFFTMEYLSGLSLDSVLSAHSEVALSRAHALMIIRDVAAALEHAHSRGVVHGDLNPGNIFITNDGGIRVLDFGAAHTPSATPSVGESAWDATAYATPRYASWQLLNGERPDARDDAYSLACILYVLLAGKHPFGELNAAQARAQRVKARRPAGLTGKQWHALRAGLSFDRQRRPADIAAWLEPFDLPKPEVRLPMLLALLKSSPRRPRLTGTMAALVLFVLAAAGAAWWASGHRDTVAQTADEAGSNLKGLIASASSAMAQLWQNARNTVSGSPAQEPVAAVPPTQNPEPAAAPTHAPTPPPRHSSPAPRSESLASASGAPARTGAPRAAVSATASSAPGSSPRSAAEVSRTRIELAADTVDVTPGDPAAHVMVRRSGNLRGDASFTWWTESGTAKPGKDFMNVKPHEEHFDEGKATTTLFVPVVADPTRKQPESFYIVINDPGEGASLGKRTLTMVTIMPPSN